jgi:hypothetical protein
MPWVETHVDHRRSLRDRDALRASRGDALTVDVGFNPRHRLTGERS